ncbi:MAG: FAD-dependent oxidoreductase [Candidatus Diapherotrites archaeon]|jgi:thioredoxin reductase (NADPH)|uniref:FAD-dependent oxidoreductase n=1 Tax=Candidatus Iainarchaeum sp. TaxID=3101447 RepID=A0A7K4BZD6_9ARCH|nr:FAD-dependent oxidoreductase [Candidatus Diapherotrites archaeon]
MEEKIREYDIAIIGAGPAGLTCGIYAARYGQKTVIIEKALYGGTATLANTIQNWPGEKNISGIELMMKFKEHAEKSNAEFIINTVTEIKEENDLKRIIMQGEEILAKTIVVSVGSKSKWLKVKGEKELLNKGVHFCATCDGAMYNEKIVAVIGQDNRAVEEAIYLTNTAKKVILISEKKELTADKAKQDILFGKKIEIIKEASVVEFVGKEKLEKMLIRKKNGEEEEITLDAAFVYVGTDPNTEFIDVEKDKNGRIIVDKNMNTSNSGIFAAGDCISKELMQIITSSSEGAIAAHSATKYIQENFKK